MLGGIQCSGNEHDVALFLALLTGEFGGDARDFWKIVLK